MPTAFPGFSAKPEETELNLTINIHGEGIKSSPNTLVMKTGSSPKFLLSLASQPTEFSNSRWRTLGKTTHEKPTRP